MFGLSLTACSFYFQKLNSRKQNHIQYLNAPVLIESTKKSPSRKSSVQTLFTEYFNNHSKTVADDNIKRTFRCIFEDKFVGQTDNFVYIYTLIRSGAYGDSSEITDVATNIVKYKKAPNEADERLFYLCIVIPRDNNDVKVQKGIMFFQNTGPFGVKTVTTDSMIKFFSTNYNLALKIRTIAPELFIKKIITKDSIKNIIMIKNHKSSDGADSVNIGYGEESKILGKLFYKDTAWDKIFNKIQYFAKGKYNLFEFENKEYDKLKVKVLIGERERTIDLHNLENLSIIEGIPDEIKMADGTPNEKELIKHFIKVANEYLLEMVLQIN
jgi:hypothetical protein